MRFIYSTLKLHINRAGRYALLALIVSIVALGGLLAGGGASSQDRFTMAEATTTEDNGKRVKAKTGFELVAKDKTTIVARRATKSTTSVDSRKCICSPAPPTGYFCDARMEGGVAVCGRDGSACCKWVSVN